MDLQPITRASASDEVYDRLVTSIVRGEVTAGDPMPSERALADGLGVSRPVVREAMKRLAHAGLVRIRHGGATLVSDYRRTAGPDLLGTLLLDRAGELDLGVARAIVEARSDLGPPVAAAAARRATDADLDAVDAAVAALRGGTTPGERQRRALDVWDRVVDASHNVVHRLLFNALRRAYEPVMDALVIVMRDEVSDDEGYAAVADALRARRPDVAAAAVRSLVDHGARAAVALIDQLTAPDSEETP